MKKALYLSLITATIAALTSTTASAQSASANVNITATIVASCTINGTANGGTQTLDFSNTTASPSTTISTAKKTATFANVLCNTPSHITLQSSSGKAANAATAPSAFQNFFDYSAVATWNTVTDSLSTATDGTTLKTSATTAPAAAGSLTVDVTPSSPSLPLVAGSYVDVLTVTLTAN